MADPTSPLPPAHEWTVGLVLALFALVSAVLIAVVAIAVRNINRTESSNDWVNHTHAVIIEIDGVLGILHGGDGAMRTFAMTGDARDRAASRGAVSALSEHMEIAKALTRDEPVQNAQILAIETLANQRADLAQRVPTAGQTDRAQPVRLLVTADATMATTSEIRSAAEKLKAEEMALAGRNGWGFENPP